MSGVLPRDGRVARKSAFLRRAARTEHLRETGRALFYRTMPVGTQSRRLLTLAILRKIERPGVIAISCVLALAASMWSVALPHGTNT